GKAIRIAKEDAALASRNGSMLPNLWLTCRIGWVQMEAYEFAEPQAIYERHAASPDSFSEPHHYIKLLWLGQARLGVGDAEGAWEALERMHARMKQGGMTFRFVCP